MSVIYPVSEDIFKIAPATAGLNDRNRHVAALRNAAGDLTIAISWLPHNRAKEGQNTRVTWAHFGDRLMRCDGTEKNGPAFIIGPLPDETRRRGIIEKPLPIYLICLDFDCGITFDEVYAIMSRMGLHCVLATTHSHMTTQTSFAAIDWHKAQTARADDPRWSASDYLIERHKLPAVAAGARLLSDDGKIVTFQHQPNEKLRAYVPLASPWLCDHLQFREAMRGFLAKHDLTDIVDNASTVHRQLWYLPRAPEERMHLFRSAIVDGRLLQPEELAAMAARAPAMAARAPDLPRLFKPPSSQSTRRSNLGGLPHGTAQLLQVWIRRDSAWFRIVDALHDAEARGIDVGFTPYVNGDRFHIRCPYEAEHSQAPSGRECFIANGRGPGKSFGIGCRHGHCHERSRLDFIAQLLRQNILTFDDLRRFSEKPDTVTGER